ncbi:hypothetical protein PTSG_08956 [Salpingoeca rosetta]|uniref:Calponin-homology (CH) domain-containing protein n=1 Tax=Salpingoeca rosetta (strain ATCC 50818 / BSB-021) TaxID=946362 RepID=F2ULS9_SALR5|nr:uncharacterized protein PTSG_08956 [Salpingoeca rosetta]EGD78078.1 hypothetical protein PTSG_08956 [Salpingoeca rosetta]|eukprot:XP_004989754.1 hypothetical protein PTSG_08956 [Salpingoeca rosetta]
MTSILCQWLNEDVHLSSTIDADRFAEQFSNGYLFAELLTKHNLPCDVRTFSKSKSAEAKLNNFLKLEPSFRALRIPFDANMARDIMEGKHGVASRLAYQLFVQLSQFKSGDFTWSEKLRAAGTQPEPHFASTLRQSTKRQIDLDHMSIEERFKDRQRQQEEKALRAQRAAEQQALAIRKQKHAATLERSREIKRQYDERVKQFAGPTKSRITQQRKGPPVATLSKSMRQAHLANKEAVRQQHQDMVDLTLFETRHGLHDGDSGDGTGADDTTIGVPPTAADAHGGHVSSSSRAGTGRGNRGTTTPRTSGGKTPTSNTSNTSSSHPRPPSRPRTGSARPRVASARRNRSVTDDDDDTAAASAATGATETGSEGAGHDDSVAPLASVTSSTRVHDAIARQPRPVTSASTMKLFDNDFVNAVRSRKREEEAARTDRERRRKRMLVEQLELQNEIAAEMDRRMEEMQRRRQSNRDDRIAAQLTKLKAEKLLMRENRIQRQREALERREKDFAAALDREAEYARKLKEDHREELERKAQNLKTLKAKKAAAQRAQTSKFCRESVEEIVSLALKKIEYSHQYGGKDVPIATWLNWKQLFIKGFPLDVAEDSDHHAHDHLDDCELFHYLDLEGIWGSVAKEDEKELKSEGDPNVPNPILHHVVTTLVDRTYPNPQPWEPAAVPHHKLRCIVSCKPSKEVEDMLHSIAKKHNASVLDAQQQEESGPHLSLRAQLGTLALSRLSKGEPVEDRVLCAIVVHGIRQLDPASSGWILCNFPRTRIQAELLERCLSGRVITSRPPTPTTHFPRADSLLLKNQQSHTTSHHNTAIGGSGHGMQSHPTAAKSGTSLGGAKASAAGLTGAGAACSSSSPSTTSIADGKPLDISQRSIDSVIVLDMSDEAVLNRVLGRRIDPETGQRVHIDDVDALLHTEDDAVSPHGKKSIDLRTSSTEAMMDPSASFEDSPLIRLTEVEDGDLAGDKVEQMVATYNAEAPAMHAWYDRHFGVVTHINGNGAASAVDSERGDVAAALEKAVVWALETEAREAQEAWQALHAEEERVQRTLSQPIIAVQEQATVEAAVAAVHTSSSPNLAGDGSGGDNTKPKSASTNSNRGSGDTTSKAASERGSSALGAPKSPSAARKKSGKKGSGSSRPGTRGSRPASKRGGQDKDKDKDKDKDGAATAGGAMGGHVPDADKLKQEAGAIKAEKTRAATELAGSGGALHRARDEQPTFVDLTVDAELAKGLVPLWDVMERCYVGDVKQMLRNLRHCRQNSSESLSALEREIMGFLSRPDAAQEYVNSWQRAFNEVPDKLRGNDACKAELYQRVEELKDALYDICDQRKQEADDLLQQRANDLMTDDQCNIALNAFIGLMQAEVDRYVQTQQLLSDTYCHMQGKLADDLAANQPTLPLVDMHHKPNERTSARTKKKQPMADIVPQESGVPLQLRQSMDDVGDALALTTAMTLALEAVPKRTEPAVVRQEAARAAEEEARRKAEEEAASKKKGKKGKKTAEPEEVPPPEPTEEELAAKKAEEERKAFVAAAEDEHFAAAVIEDRRFRARLHLIQHVAQGMLKQLREPASQSLERLERAIGQRYKKEHESVDRLCAQARSAIEAQVKIYRELVFIDANFDVNRDVVLSPVPRPPRPATPVETERFDEFTIAQLHALHKELSLIAPSGFIPRDDMVDLIDRLRQQPACAGALPPKFTTITRKDIASAFGKCYTPESDWVDWRMFLVDMCAIPEPKTEALLRSFAELYAMNTHGTVSWLQYNAAWLWFAPPQTTPTADVHAPRAFDRGAGLKRLLFDVFAGDAATYFGREIDFFTLFTYICRGNNGRTALSRVATLVSIAKGCTPLHEVQTALARALAAAGINTTSGDATEGGDGDGDDDDDRNGDANTTDNNGNGSSSGVVVGGGGSSKDTLDGSVSTMEAPTTPLRTVPSTPNVSVSTWSPSKDGEEGGSDGDGDDNSHKVEIEVIPQSDAGDTAPSTPAAASTPDDKDKDKDAGKTKRKSKSKSKPNDGEGDEERELSASSARKSKGRDGSGSARSRRASMNPSSARKGLKSPSRGASRRGSKIMRDDDNSNADDANNTSISNNESADVFELGNVDGDTSASTMHVEDDVVVQLPVRITSEVLLSLIAHGVRELGDIETDVTQAEHVAGAVELHQMLSLTADEAEEMIAYVQAAQEHLREQQRLEDKERAERGDGDDEGDDDDDDDDDGENEHVRFADDDSAKQGGLRAGKKTNKQEGGEVQGRGADGNAHMDDGSGDNDAQDGGGDDGDGDNDADADNVVVTADELVFGSSAPSILLPLQSKFARCTRL